MRKIQKLGIVCFWQDNKTDFILNSSLTVLLNQLKALFADISSARKWTGIVVLTYTFVMGFFAAVIRIAPSFVQHHYHACKMGVTSVLLSFTVFVLRIFTIHDFTPLAILFIVCWFLVMDTTMVYNGWENLDYGPGYNSIQVRRV